MYYNIGMDKKFILFITITLLAFSFSVYQYTKELGTDITRAAGIKPNPGHLWSEMECSSDLCVNNGKIGMGTESPSKKLEVNGDILASGTGDVCNGSGKCLSSVFQTNVIAGTNPTCPTGQTMIMKAYNGSWYTADNASITSWNKVTCGVVLTSDGTSLLVNGNHTRKNCTDNSGTVASDGTYDMCRFNLASCPSGWTQYGNWSTTIAGIGTSPSFNCSDSGDHPAVSPSYSGVATGYHSWSNTAIEATGYYCSHASNCVGCGCSPTSQFSSSTDQTVACWHYWLSPPSTGCSQQTMCGSGVQPTRSQIGCY